MVCCEKKNYLVFLMDIVVICNSGENWNEFLKI